MGNQLQLFQRIKDSTLIDFTGVTYGVTAGIIARMVGDSVPISAVTDAGGGDVTITAANHGLLAGEYVTQDLVSSNYDGTFLVKSITDGNNYVITATWGATSSGMFVDEYQDSPVGGDVIRVFYPTGASSPTARINLATPQNVYPNCGIVYKTNQIASYSWSFGFQPQTDNNFHKWNFDALKQRSMGYVVNEWAHVSFVNNNKVESGTVLPWATGESDQAFLTSSIALFGATGSVDAPGAVFYIAAVYTDNFPKAKLILQFDDFPSTVNTEAFPKLQSKGWKASAAAIGSLLDTNAASRARVQQLYDAGWDIINHTWSHNQASATMSDGTWIEDALRCYNWQIENGWTRGSNFIAYPLLLQRLFGNDGGDVAERFFALGRGSADRERYGFQNRSAERSANTLNNQIPDDAISIEAVQDAGSTLYAGGAITSTSTAAGPTVIVTSAGHGLVNGDEVIILDIPPYEGTFAVSSVTTDTFVITVTNSTVSETGSFLRVAGVKNRLAEVNKSHGVMIVYMHGIETPPPTESDNSVEWFDAFLADIQGYVDAGTMEVAIPSEWYNELSGDTSSTTATSGGYRARYN